MIIGNGLIAEGFKKYFSNDDEFLFFASGVSNSNESRASEFKREKKLLQEAIERNHSKVFVYFSSCGINSSEHTQYFSHKLDMENLVKTKRSDYYIFRLPQVVGETKNPNTLINFLYTKLKNNSELVLWKNARRNLIDIDDVVAVVRCIIRKGLEKNTTINIASPIDYSVEEIVSSLEDLLKINGTYTLLDKGSPLKIDTTHLSNIFSELNIVFNKNYLDVLIRKYY